MPTSGNILDRNVGGGAYFDAAPYPIRAARMIYGEEPERVACVMNIDQTRGIPTQVDMILAFADGASALISSAFGSYYQSYYDILGTQGRIRTERAFPVGPERSVQIFVSTNDETQAISIAPADHFQLMVDNFCDVITGEKTADFESDLMAQARVLEAGSIAFKEARTVSLSELK